MSGQEQWTFRIAMYSQPLFVLIKMRKNKTGICIQCLEKAVLFPFPFWVLQVNILNKKTERKNELVCGKVGNKPKALKRGQWVLYSYTNMQELHPDLIIDVLWVFLFVFFFHKNHGYNKWFKQKILRDAQDPENKWWCWCVCGGQSYIKHFYPPRWGLRLLLKRRWEICMSHDLWNIIV